MLATRKVLLLLCTALFFSSTIQAQETTKKGKTPIIIIPGLTGSELINKATGELVWFQTRRSKDDDIRLPINSVVISQNKDNLIPRDVIRNVKLLRFLPEIEIYAKLIESLKVRGGYEEGKWDNPTIKGYEDTFYVFGYDWRLDNVENARFLMRKIDELKRKLKRPNLKFNVIAHSMGGLIARYAAMYGDSDLPSGKPLPTWAGAKNFNKIFLLGTPNEGSPQSLGALINGFSYLGGGLNIPFFQNLSKFDTFTIPSLYQLLPHSGTLRAFDENLKPLEIDLFNPKTWDQYGWNVINDKDFPKNFTMTEQRKARDYFEAVLNRARRFHEALNSNTNPKTSVEIHLIGGDCKDTLDGILVYRNKKNEWKTLFEADSLARGNGEKVSADEIRKLLFSMGDGVVARRSLANETLLANLSKTVLPITSEFYVCENHTRLVSAKEAQNKLFSLLQDE